MQEADPAHSILACPWQYSIVGLSFHRTLDHSEEAYLDLTLQRESVVRRIRFFGPRDLCVERGFEQDGAGLYISDVRQRGLDALGVRVGNDEPVSGGVSFWARTVVDLDLHNHTEST